MARITKIELKNFKSFKDVNIPINQGFTVVVGPNGSGKSNLLDAVAFTMGTGSMKSLRASRLEDLINSNEKGKAEVTLQVQNAKKETRTVTRSINKEGHCTYKVDGQKSTKNLMVETLESIGMPTDGHNIVMQGDVARVIEMTPLQRRTIIDDISGIAEYDEKKQKSLRELENVETKIKDVKIVLGEKIGRLDELKREREEALQYKNLEQRLKRLKATVLGREISALEKEFTAVYQRFENSQSQVKEYSSQREKLAAKLAEAEKKLSELNKELVEKEGKDGVSIFQQIEQTKNEINLRDQETESKKQQKQRTLEKTKELEKQLEELEKEIKNEQKKLQNLAKQKEQIIDNLEKQEKKLKQQRGELEKQNKDVFESLEKTTQELGEKKEQYFSLKGQIEALSEKKKIRDQNKAEKTIEQQQAVEKASQLKQNKAKIIEQKQTLEKEKNILQDELQKAYEKEKNVNQKLSALEREWDEKKSLYGDVSAKARALSVAANPAVEACLSARDKGELPGIIGTVSELVEYSEEHATAIETAAGARLSYVITEDEKTAISCVKYLKENRVGRASFIPLSKIRGNPASGAKPPGSIDYASNLIKYPKKIQPAIDYVFGNTVVIRTIDDAKKLGVGKHRMVSLDGDVSELSGAITGGIKRNASMQLLKKYRELKNEMEQIAQDKQEYTNLLESLRGSVVNKRSQLAENEIRLKELEIQLKATQERLAELSEKLGEKIISEENLEQQIREKQAKISSLENEIKRLEQQKNASEQKLEQEKPKALIEKINQSEKVLDEIYQQRNTLNIEIEKIRATIEEKTRGEKNQTLARIKELEQENNALEQEIKKLGKEKQGLEKTLAEKKEKEKQLSKHLVGLKKKRDEAEKNAMGISQEKGSLDQKVDRLKDELVELSGKKEKHETRLTDLKVEFEEYKQEKQVRGNIEELKKELEETDKNLRQMGEVNMKAIELYNTQKKGVKDAEEKLATLENEREAIFSMMMEVEKHRNSVFMEAFNAVNKSFQDMASKIIKGEGKLVLENPEEPLEGGLNIEAQLSGRKVERLESMSGGEKSLTALTFLFAIQMYNPSPFYLLDEADAALDKINSEKIANVLKELSKKSQFMVVTHNPPTIKRADQMIGVSKNSRGTTVIEVSVPGGIKYDKIE